MEGVPQIAAPLYVQPEISAVAKHSSEHKRSIGSYRAPIIAQFIDVLAWYAHRLRKVALSEAQRLHEFLGEDFSNARRLTFGHQHFFTHR
jgi:hypothetical protein